MHPISILLGFAVLVAIFRESWDGKLVEDYYRELDPNIWEDITIGRKTSDSEPTVPIGLGIRDKVGDALSRACYIGISRQFATIYRDEEGRFVLRDDRPEEPDKPRSNGIFIHNRKITSQALEPGLKFTLYYASPAVIELEIKEEITAARHRLHDTYTPDQIQDAIYQQSKDNGDRITAVEQRLEHFESKVEAKFVEVKTEIQAQQELNAGQSAEIEEYRALFNQMRSLFTNFKAWLPKLVFTAALVWTGWFFVNLPEDKQKGFEKYIGLIGPASAFVGGGLLEASKKSKTENAK